MERAAEALAQRAADLDGAGRVLAAANGSLDFPDDPFERLWHATTVLREHRGDGHVAALVAAGLDGCETLAPRAAEHRLLERGLLAPDGSATKAGRETLRTAEAATDRAAERPWQTLGPDETADLVGLLTPLATACGSALRFPNPIGVPEPTG